MVVKLLNGSSITHGEVQPQKQNLNGQTGQKLDGIVNYYAMNRQVDREKRQNAAGHAMWRIPASEATSLTENRPRSTHPSREYKQKAGLTSPSSVHKNCPSKMSHPRNRPAIVHWTHAIRPVRCPNIRHALGTPPTNTKQHEFDKRGP